MIVKLLHTDGHGVFEEIEWNKPEITDDEIEVKAVMTGVCRSDIDMMEGNFGPLPLHMQGHEGLGIVTGVGHNIVDVMVGDYVATRGEPAYADYYNVKQDEYVFVPELHPKYILEPVACGVNIIQQPLEEIVKRAGDKKRCLILGSGFLAWIAYNSLKSLDLNFKDIVVVGNHNKDLWGDTLKQKYRGSFDIVIDLSDKTDTLDKDFLNNNALVIFGVQKKITTDFANLLWKACTVVFPSPRNPDFKTAMETARDMISAGKLKIDKFWTRRYNRSKEWKLAFEEGLHRPKGYSRGYIEWD
jgi:D-arabinose 1-dehydrogenase-like Zn-dependent alcohol dehydrogenase